MRVSEGYTDKPLTKACDFSLTVRSDLTLYAKRATKSQPYAILYKGRLLSLQAALTPTPLTARSSASGRGMARLSLA